HGDVKPSNVIVDGRAQAYLMDVGLARRAGCIEGASTEDLSGTPAYVAPEQLGPTPARNQPAADQYSLGAVLYELLTGELPFEGPAEAVRHQGVPTEPRRPCGIPRDIPRSLEAICLKAMAKDSAQRYADCALMRDDIKHWLDGKMARVVTESRTSGRGRWLLLGIALAVVAGATLFRIWPRQPD